MFFLLVFFSFSIQLGTLNGYNECHTVDDLIQVANFIEDTYRDPVEMDGVLVDRRIGLFKEFEHYCLDKYFKYPAAAVSEDDRSNLLNVIKKAFFYTRSYAVVDNYRIFLKRNFHHYDSANDYFDLIDQARYQHEVAGSMLLLSSSAEIHSLEGKDVVLIISSPNCKFSNNLMRWVNSAEAFSKDVDLIWAYKLPVGVSPEVFFSVEINRKFHVFLDVEDWTSIKLWDTPTVYIIRDGGVVRQSVGFTEESKALLSEVLNPSS
ncbi:hypothetical protein QWY20_18455 [Alkalimonas sp. MEB108]|uniref:Thioredoxin domain-containing protein n=1 Tax=Alkalimonas cellulosilytica TaxID=3058395 RepID=A0ABU7JA68_9GAMM|nr:hypothetical protein [Alkalimonas sp. MEB108]MEE2003431.1 hypothetical protein [Alkalimonas sp. MEB108]